MSKVGKKKERAHSKTAKKHGKAKDQIFTKSLSQNPCSAVGHPRAGEMEKGLKVWNFFLPANEQPTKSVEPRMRTFHHPSTCSVARNLLLLRRMRAALGNVRRVTVLGHQRTHIGIVIAFVLAHVLRFFLRRLRPRDWNTLDRFFDEAL